MEVVFHDIFIQLEEIVYYPSITKFDTHEQYFATLKKLSAERDAVRKTEHIKEFIARFNSPYVGFVTRNEVANLTMEGRKEFSLQKNGDVTVLTVTSLWNKKSVEEICKIAADAAKLVLVIPPYPEGEMDNWIALYSTFLGTGTVWSALTPFKRYTYALKDYKIANCTGEVIVVCNSVNYGVNLLFLSDFLKQDRGILLFSEPVVATEALLVSTRVLKDGSLLYFPKAELNDSEYANFVTMFRDKYVEKGSLVIDRQYAELGRAVKDFDALFARMKQ